MDKSLPIRVETYHVLNRNGDIDTHNQEPESMKKINYASSSDRKWLTNHSMWALNNGRAVLTSPCEPGGFIESRILRSANIL